MNSDMTSHSSETSHESGLDPEVCRRARLSRDVRFDGEFYIAVHTTGIYCRPICPARTPAENNVSYFHSAALAVQAGFRPCLRCRPESAPNSPAWNGTSTTVERALQLIGQGHPDTFPLKDLGLERAWARLPGPDITLKDQSAHWRPWGSYAANLLWRSLSL